MKRILSAFLILLLFLTGPAALAMEVHVEEAPEISPEELESLMEFYGYTWTYDGENGYYTAQDEDCIYYLLETTGQLYFYNKETKVLYLYHPEDGKCEFISSKVEPGQRPAIITGGSAVTEAPEVVERTTDPYGDGEVGVYSTEDGSLFIEMPESDYRLYLPQGLWLENATRTKHSRSLRFSVEGEPEVQILLNLTFDSAYAGYTYRTLPEDVLDQIYNYYVASYTDGDYTIHDDKSLGEVLSVEGYDDNRHFFTIYSKIINDMVLTVSCGTLSDTKNETCSELATALFINAVYIL